MVWGKVNKNQLGQQQIRVLGTLLLQLPGFAKDKVGVTNSRSLKLVGQVSFILYMRPRPKGE